MKNEKIMIGDIISHPDGFNMTFNGYLKSKYHVFMDFYWFDNDKLMNGKFKVNDIFPDYLLIKDLPGHKKGCIFSMGSNYIYYISYDPERVGWIKIDDKFDPSKDSLLRFNIDQITSNKEWFLKIDNQVYRDLKIEEICR